MGACGSTVSAETEKARQINKEIEQASRKDRAAVKLLLLGAGSSGKTTIFKQMRILYGAGFDESTRKTFTLVIRRSVCTDMQLLLSNIEALGHELFTEESEEAGKLVLEMDLGASFRRATDNFSPEIREALSCLWKDPGVRDAFKDRGKLQMNDSFEFYMNAFARIAEEDYVPTVEDVLNARVRTSGIVEEKYMIDGVEFRMYDVGGQRNERKKWIHCFEDVTAVIFVAAVSEYNQVLFEDESTNRIVESVNLFGKTATEKQKTSMILFLNKSDLFEKKLLVDRIPIRQEDAGLFLDYDGGADIGLATQYMTRMFLDAAEQPGDDKSSNSILGKREIFPHVTCATNTDNVAHVFGACREIINKQNIAASGFTS